MALVFVSCNQNTPTKDYEGVWTVMENQHKDVLLPDSSKLVIIYSDFYKEVHIMADSMIAYTRSDNARYNYHYRVVKDGVIELERTFLQDPSREDYIEEVTISFDEEKHLIIEKFSPGDLSQVYPPIYLPVMLSK